MITKNYKNHILASMCGRDSGNDISSNSPAVSVDGYGCFVFGLQYDSSLDATLSANNSGISIGTGSTPATEDDINLESTITSGISMSVSSREKGVDANGMPMFKYKVTVTNTGSSSVTVREIGLKLLLYYSPFPNASRYSNNYTAFLVDRTVLDEPITIEAGEAGVITYLLSSSANPVKPPKNGVELVHFSSGTDTQIAAMIDAAHEGLIDLQTDGGWKIGDMRKISLASFTAAGKTCSAQDIFITISSLADYISCGCVMQFDFVNVPSSYFPMHSSSSYPQSYKDTIMYSDILPAFANALPSWLSTRLITFSAYTGKGSPATELEEITGNKLCLRSESEICGTHGNSLDGEGTRIPFYANGYWNKKRDSSNTVKYWLRSKPVSSSTKAVFMSDSGIPTSLQNSTNSTTCYLAPFGCL